MRDAEAAPRRPWGKGAPWLQIGWHPQCTVCSGPDLSTRSEAWKGDLMSRCVYLLPPSGHSSQMRGYGRRRTASVHAEANPRMHYGLYFSCYLSPFFLITFTYLFMIWSVKLRLEYRTEWNPDKLELADNSWPYGDHISPAVLQHLGDRPDLLVQVGGKRSRKTWSELTKQLLPVGFPGLMMHRALGLQCVRASSTARCSSLMSRLQHFSSFR